MDPSHLQELIDLEETYWWHLAKRQLVASLLVRMIPPPGRLIEGGIGSAGNLMAFAKLGYDVSGLDILPAAVDHARQRGLEQVWQHDLSQPWPQDDQSARVVVLLDVLEHMADPQQVLQHARAVLRPGGGIVVTVPAYGWLYSQWDRALGHYRRYTADQLVKLAAAASLRVSWLSYWNSFSLPAAMVVRTFQRLVPREQKPDFPRISPVINRLLLTMAAWERWYLRKGRAPLGLSLVGVLQK
jgi:SAM-dependent methyltransferase